jgi:hypothetical protein
VVENRLIVGWVKRWGIAAEVTILMGDSPIGNSNYVSYLASDINEN